MTAEQPQRNVKKYFHRPVRIISVVALVVLLPIPVGILYQWYSLPRAGTVCSMNETAADSSTEVVFETLPLPGWACHWYDASGQLHDRLYLGLFPSLDTLRQGNHNFGG